MSICYNFAIFYNTSNNCALEGWNLADFRSFFPNELMLTHNMHPSIDTLTVTPELEKLKNNLLKYNTVEYMGQYNADDIRTFCNEHPKTPQESDYYPSNVSSQDSYIIDKLQWTLHKDQFERASVLDPTQKPVAFAMRIQKTYQRGWWLDFNSFDKFIETRYSNLRLHMFKLRDWKRMKNSLEFLKLSEAEKENVQESFDDLPQEPDTVEDSFDNNYELYLLTQALQMKGVFKLFDSYRDVYMFVYDTSSSVELGKDALI